MEAETALGSSDHACDELLAPGAKTEVLGNTSHVCVESSCSSSLSLTQPSSPTTTTPLPPTLLPPPPPRDPPSPESPAPPATLWIISRWGEEGAGDDWTLLSPPSCDIRRDSMSYCDRSMFSGISWKCNRIWFVFLVLSLAEAKKQGKYTSILMLCFPGGSHPYHNLRHQAVIQAVPNVEP